MLRLLLVSLLSCVVFAQEGAKSPYKVESIPPKMSIKTKKERFFALMLPPILDVYNKLDREFQGVKVQLQDKNATQSYNIQQLKQSYGVKSDEELLKALKPHPPSIALAQAAMESAWGTSRFFREANNVFGMWNNNPDAQRIAAGEKRDGKHTVYLSKYDSLEQSVKAYYKTLAKGKSYKEFREVRFVSDDVFEMVKKLDKYSERAQEYTKELESMIRYNKLTQYDKKKKVNQ